MIELRPRDMVKLSPDTGGTSGFTVTPEKSADLQRVLVNIGVQLRHGRLTPFPVAETTRLIETGGFSLDELRLIQRAAIDAQFEMMTRPDLLPSDALSNREALPISLYPYTAVILAAEQIVRKLG